MVSLYHSLEENEASRVDFDGKSCVFLVVDSRCWMGCLTAKFRCGCAAHNLQSGELHPAQPSPGTNVRPVPQHQTRKTRPAAHDGKPALNLNAPVNSIMLFDNVVW